MSRSVAKLYYGNPSLWSAVVRMTIVEKGYGPDEIEFKLVDLAAADNYKPEYLLINPFATVPALVVPLEKSLAPEMDVKYKALTDSKPIVEFLDKSRSALSHTHTTSSAPAPVLTPATISHLSTCNKIIELVRGEPSAALLRTSARTEAEILAIAQSPWAATVRNRHAGLKKALTDEEAFIPKKALPTLEARLPPLEAFVQAFDAVLVDPSSRTLEQKHSIESHLGQSAIAWDDTLPKVLAALEREIVGPLALGDYVSLADMYLAAWVTRLVVICSGDGTPEAASKIPGAGPKLRAFWQAIIERRSWKEVYGDRLF
ncbi:hypothetical protein AURDEDRAFT_179182 [Auricularia subglabra TFB-10046 SS5]|nr:hypothetical protein AURDEDRAFT_179182 [Auricularia subglabra TFB-10046 SS5]